MMDITIRKKLYTLAALNKAMINATRKYADEPILYFDNIPKGEQI